MHIFVTNRELSIMIKNKKKILLFILFYFLFQLLFSQKISYFGQIKGIIDKNCISCHFVNGDAPFSLTSFEDVKHNAEMIKSVIISNYMPPWKADSTFQKYKNQRFISLEEKKLISEWITNGKKKGKSPKKISQNLKKLKEIETPDLTVGFNQKYKLQNDNQDDFRFFYTEVKNIDKKYIRKINFKPGIAKIIHHSRIMIDTFGGLEGINGLSENDERVYFFQTKPLYNDFFYGWLPGNSNLEFPDGVAQVLPENSNFIFNLHYSPNSQNELFDSSEIQLFFTDKPVTKIVNSLILRETHISNKPFIIPKSKSTKFYMSYGPIKDSLEIISVQPHAHNLCKNFRSFCITPDGDMIPLIQINDWDFNWQETYYFTDPLQLPKGSIIIAEAEYDNTDKNLSNPYLPPKDVGYGWKTKDEMMNLIINYLKPNF